MLSFLYGPTFTSIHDYWKNHSFDSMDSFGGSDSKESACNAGDPGSIPRLGRSAGEGIGYPLQYYWASLVAQMVKNLPAMGVTWVKYLGSNQSIVKEISPEYSLEELMLKLKLQYFGHLMRRANSLEKTPMLGKIEGRRRRGQQRPRWLEGTTDLMDMSLIKFREMVKDREAWHAAVHGVAKSWTRLSN